MRSTPEGFDTSIRRTGDADPETPVPCHGRSPSHSVPVELRCSSARTHRHLQASVPGRSGNTVRFKSHDPGITFQRASADRTVGRSTNHLAVDLTPIAEPPMGMNDRRGSIQRLLPRTRACPADGLPCDAPTLTASPSSGSLKKPKISISPVRQIVSPYTAITTCHGGWRDRRPRFGVCLRAWRIGTCKIHLPVQNRMCERSLRWRQE